MVWVLCWRQKNTWFDFLLMVWGRLSYWFFFYMNTQLTQHLYWKIFSTTLWWHLCYQVGDQTHVGCVCFLVYSIFYLSSLMRHRTGLITWDQLLVSASNSSCFSALLLKLLICRQYYFVHFQATFWWDIARDWVRALFQTGSELTSVLAVLVHWCGVRPLPFHSP